MAEIAAGSTATMAAARAWARARLYDDKLGEADAPRLAAWAESIERWKLDAPDLIEGVIRHYEQHGAPTIQIGDLLHHAREVRRLRAEAEKAAESHAAAGALPAGSGWAGLPINARGIPVWPAYEVGEAINRPCPRCHAEAGDACITSRDQPQKIPCLPRIKNKPTT